MFLNCHSYYSLRYGTIAPADLLALAGSFGVETLALTDINSTSAVMEFIQLAEKLYIRPVIGVDFRNKAKQQFIILAKNNTGFRNINEYLRSEERRVGKAY